MASTTFLSQHDAGTTVMLRNNPVAAYPFALGHYSTTVVVDMMPTRLYRAVRLAAAVSIMLIFTGAVRRIAAGVGAAIRGTTIPRELAVARRTGVGTGL